MLSANQRSLLGLRTYIMLLQPDCLIKIVGVVNKQWPNALIPTAQLVRTIRKSCVGQEPLIYIAAHLIWNRIHDRLQISLSGFLHSLHIGIYYKSCLEIGQNRTTYQLLLKRLIWISNINYVSNLYILIYNIVV